jgi:hypothetical protein
VRGQGRVRDLANRPQWMIRPNPVLQDYVAEKAAANLVVAAHCHSRSPHQEITGLQIGNDFFNSLLEPGRALIYRLFCTALIWPPPRRRLVTH